MKATIYAFALSVFGVSAPAVISAAVSKTIILAATADFPILKVDNFAQTRIEQGKAVISVDGDITGFAFGMAQTRFQGVDGLYDVTITTVQDGDGVCEYFLRVGAKDTDIFRQTGMKGGMMEDHTWKRLIIRRGELIGVAGNGSDSAQNAPGKGPRGFHMAHGRWSKLALVRVGDAPGS